LLLGVPVGEPVAVLEPVCVPLGVWEVLSLPERELGAVLEGDRLGEGK
jgi:hypothetical protein